MVESTPIDFDPTLFTDIEDVTAMADAQAEHREHSVFLAIHPKGYKLFLEPLGKGALRGIVARNGTQRLPTPDSLAGAFTDIATAKKAVEVWLSSVGNTKPKGRTAASK